MDTNGSEVIEEEDFLKSPPNFLEAENHSKAQIIHQEVISNSQKCPCCNLYISTLKYSLFTDINAFIVHGTVYKYFLFIKNVFILLSINFIIVGIYNLIQNFKGNSCIKNETCKQNLNNYLSILNRMDSYYFEDYILDILQSISIFIQLAFLRYISYSKNDCYSIDRQIDSEFTIKKCSLKIKNLPSNCNKKEGMNLFVANKYKRDSAPLNIIDCSLIYDQEHLENQLKLKIKEILSQNNDTELFLKSTNTGFITFSSQKEAIKFKEVLDKQSVIYCPRPLDEKWINKIEKQNLLLEIILFIIGLALFYLLYQFEIAKDEYTQSNSGYQLNRNTLLSLCVAIIFKISMELQLRMCQIISQYGQYKRMPWYFYELLIIMVGLMNVIVFPIAVFEQKDQYESKLKFWRDGGFNEDIIYIILINSFSIMIFSVIDKYYALNLLKNTYYKYLKQNSTLTQFEANQLTQKKLNFNEQYIELVHLCFLCSYYGYIYPICYPMTLIALLIIFWLQKYQLINYGVKENIRFEKEQLKLPILILLICQTSSHQVIQNVLKTSLTTRPFFYVFIILSFLLIYLIFFSDWIFINQSLDYQTSEVLMKSIAHNDLYSQLNPLINENLWLGDEYEKGLRLHKFSRQEKYYNELQVKLLRELEREFQQNSLKKTTIQPIQGEQIILE
ncbi:unnamed protein product [Paramecium pentaurelia]|uniref:CSC1/OSCA1-like cytosolic domain-containing protein n=1 Tax=Paramecium pentaurelia TaxID=43138 RepID=A0A8S1WML9_9CILI|nr:unnamed protein product [Paramecium pentaurelia]